MPLAPFDALQQRDQQGGQRSCSTDRCSEPKQHHCDNDTHIAGPNRFSQAFQAAVVVPDYPYGPNIDCQHDH